MFESTVCARDQTTEAKKTPQKGVPFFLECRMQWLARSPLVMLKVEKIMEAIFEAHTILPLQCHAFENQESWCMIEVSHIQ